MSVDKCICRRICIDTSCIDLSLLSIWLSILVCDADLILPGSASFCWTCTLPNEPFPPLHPIIDAPTSDSLGYRKQTSPQWILLLYTCHLLRWVWHYHTALANVWILDLRCIPMMAVQSECHCYQACVARYADQLCGYVGVHV